MIKSQLKNYLSALRVYHSSGLESSMIFLLLLGLYVSLLKKTEYCITS